MNQKSLLQILTIFAIPTILIILFKYLDWVLPIFIVLGSIAFFWGIVYSRYRRLYNELNSSKRQLKESLNKRNLAVDKWFYKKDLLAWEKIDNKKPLLISSLSEEDLATSLAYSFLSESRNKKDFCYIDFSTFNKDSTLESFSQNVLEFLNLYNREYYDMRLLKDVLTNSSNSIFKLSIDTIKLILILFSNFFKPENSRYKTELLGLITAIHDATKAYKDYAIIFTNVDKCKTDIAEATYLLIKECPSITSTSNNPPKFESKELLQNRIIECCKIEKIITSDLDFFSFRVYYEIFINSKSNITVPFNNLGEVDSSKLIKIISNTHNSQLLCELYASSGGNAQLAKVIYNRIEKSKNIETVRIAKELLDKHLPQNVTLYCNETGKILDQSDVVQCPSDYEYPIVDYSTSYYKNLICNYFQINELNKNETLFLLCLSIIPFSICVSDINKLKETIDPSIDLGKMISTGILKKTNQQFYCSIKGLLVDETYLSDDIRFFSDSREPDQNLNKTQNNNIRFTTEGLTGAPYEAAQFSMMLSYACKHRVYDSTKENIYLAEPIKLYLMTFSSGELVEEGLKIVKTFTFEDSQNLFHLFFNKPRKEDVLNNPLDYCKAEKDKSLHYYSYWSRIRKKIDLDFRSTHQYDIDDLFRVSHISGLSLSFSLTS